MTVRGIFLVMLVLCSPMSGCLEPLEVSTNSENCTVIEPGRE